MQQRYSLRALSALILSGAAILVACQKEPLSVDNTNQPDVARAYSTPAGVETIVSKLYQQEYNGQYGSADDIWTQTITMSFESHSQLGNFGMGTRAAIPRAPIDNSIGNTVANGNFRDFDFLSRNARSASNALAAIDKYLAAGFSAGGAARDARAKAFAWFNLGYALGQMSLLYDSVAILSPSLASTLAKSVQARVLVASSMSKAGGSQYGVQARLAGVNDEAGSVVSVQQSGVGLIDLGNKVADQLQAAYKSMPDAKGCVDQKSAKPAPDVGRSRLGG